MHGFLILVYLISLCEVVGDNALQVNELVLYIGQLPAEFEGAGIEEPCEVLSLRLELLLHDLLSCLLRVATQGSDRLLDYIIVLLLFVKRLDNEEVYLA